MNNIYAARRAAVIFCELPSLQGFSDHRITTAGFALFCGNFKVFFVFLTRHTAPEPVFIHLKEMVAVSNILDITVA